MPFKSFLKDSFMEGSTRKHRILMYSFFYDSLVTLYFISDYCAYIFPRARALPALLLIDPFVLSLLIIKHLVFFEPQSDFFLGAVDAIGAVANITANVL